MRYVTGKTRLLHILGLLLIVVVSCNNDMDIISEAYRNNKTTPETKENDSSEETPSGETDSISEPQNPEPPQNPDTTLVIYELRNTSLLPLDDAYLQDGKGYNESLMRLHDTIRTSYIKFDLAPIDSIGGFLKAAKLRFTVDGDSGDGKIEVYKGNGSGWTELDITTSSAPAAEVLVGSIEKNYVLGTTEEIELDASALRLEKTTLILVHQDGNDLAIGSKEHPSRISPHLLLDYEVPEGNPELPNTGDNIGQAEEPVTPEVEEPAVPEEEAPNIAPVARITASPSSGEAPLSVNFSSANSTDDNAITSHNWNFKDGNSSSNANPQHTFTDAGTYAVSLTVNDEQGLSHTATLNITVSEAPPENEAPVAVATANILNGDAPLEVLFNGAGSSDDSQVTSFFWDFGTADPSSATNPAHTFTDPGVYEVILTVKDGEGLTDTDTLTITVNQSSTGGDAGSNYPPGAVLASTFGFNTVNASVALQDAIRSDHQIIVIDKQSSDWLIEPSKFFNISNKTIIIESGVVIRAKSGAFPGTNDRLLSFVGADNLTIEGYGATLAMNKSEYTSGEGRHALSMEGVRNITVKGLTIKDSGGDGIYIGRGSQSYSENITIEDIRSLNNRREGMTIISAVDVWVRTSEFSSTKGTEPEAGVGLEPNNPDEQLVNINFDGCKFYDNNFAGFKVSTYKLNSLSAPISVNVSNSEFRSNARSTNHTQQRAEVYLGADHLDPVGGRVEFQNVTFNGSQVGVVFSKKSADSYDVVFINCEARNILQSSGRAAIHLEAAGAANTLGGFTFNNFYLEYSTNKPFITLSGSSDKILKNVNGTFTVKEPYNNPPEFIYGINLENSINVNIDYIHID